MDFLLHTCRKRTRSEAIKGPAPAAERTPPGGDPIGRPARRPQPRPAPMALEPRPKATGKPLATTATSSHLPRRGVGIRARAITVELPGDPGDSDDGPEEIWPVEPGILGAATSGTGHAAPASAPLSTPRARGTGDPRPSTAL